MPHITRRDPTRYEYGLVRVHNPSARCANPHRRVLKILSDWFVLPAEMADDLERRLINEGAWFVFGLLTDADCAHVPRVR